MGVACAHNSIYFFRSKCLEKMSYFGADKDDPVPCKNTSSPTIFRQLAFDAKSGDFTITYITR